jgi:hypothetical protein
MVDRNSGIRNNHFLSQAYTHDQHTLPSTDCHFHVVLDILGDTRIQHDVNLLLSPNWCPKSLFLGAWVVQSRCGGGA